jgi:hypothetical protein
MLSRSDGLDFPGVRPRVSPEGGAMTSGSATARNPLVAIGETSIGRPAVTDAHEEARRSQNHLSSWKNPPSSASRWPSKPIVESLGPARAEVLIE